MAPGLPPTGQHSYLRQRGAVRASAGLRTLPRRRPPTGGGTLIEIKTRQGPKNSRGLRVDTLSQLDVLQMLGYALFDTIDTYRLDTVALYSARYGRYIAWPVADLLELAAGRPVDLAIERQQVWDVLAG